ncbi:hypothetical protein FD29_GL000240 [Companilactobacillus mindensis DSM 14500]|uniref:Uncharacterized protein n=1 Tax=Companilactobacillus mindensis DSM 14500 TaxID=1423770 RepID=A0A0R1QSE1_9LACO|nr:hypothetical protein [Companilactobacillus mindensis]KRL44123.1 hypothetical protein FD29_GL000240 [Companilactobacillus mindensis DSM 14500]GEO79113.1 hypothetical protein LMI01_14440 [Companilactobacillus mindensis]
MKDTDKPALNEVKDQEYLTNNWLTSEVLIGMYSRIFTNLLLSDDRIFKGHSK